MMILNNNQPANYRNVKLFLILVNITGESTNFVQQILTVLSFKYATVHYCETFPPSLPAHAYANI